MAEGAINVTGVGLTIGPDLPGSPALLSAASGANAIVVLGANTRIRGSVQALSGQVAVIGAQTVLHCGVVASTIAITGISVHVEVDGQCAAP